MTAERPLTAERFFLRYAFPCAYVLRDQGRMSASEYGMLQEAVRKETNVPFSELERLFPAAFRRIKEVASRLGKDPHSLEAIRHYFLEDHNEFIEEGDGMYAQMPPTFCEFCKVKTLSVLAQKTHEGKLFLQVEPDRWVQAPYFSDVAVGDQVRVHHAYAIELVR